nr:MULTISPECIES: hypothetical protein [unclassified Nocardia]
MEKLLGAAVENLEHPDAVQPPNVAMRELAWLPTRCQRVLYRRGITTNAALFALSESQLRAIRPHRPPLLRILELPRDQLQQPPRGRGQPLIRRIHRVDERDERRRVGELLDDRPQQFIERPPRIRRQPLDLRDVLVERRQRDTLPRGKVPIQHPCPTPAARAIADIGTSNPLSANRIRAAATIAARFPAAAPGPLFRRPPELITSTLPEPPEPSLWADR